MPAGRPREFDADKALEKAMRVFWKKGFEGTSLPDLTRAMGINRPSLYAAFGNKEQLFRKALDRYTAANACMFEALKLPTAREVAAALLHASVDGLTCPRNPRWCFMIQGALACGDSATPLRQELALRRNQNERAIEMRFKRAVEDGDLPKTADPSALAKYLSTVTAGLSVQASGGATRQELLAVVETAMRAWPR
jgi:AcrR family transcriptional regulator